MLEKTERYIQAIVRKMGFFLAICLLLMVLNITYDVMMRYVFRASSVGMQELEWHFFSVIILFGVGVALIQEGHVRVDFVYDRLRPKTRALINIFGTILFVVPLSLLILFGSLNFVVDSYTIKEISEDPGGLHFRWLIKAMIPFSFVFLLFSAVGYIFKNIILIRGGK